MKYFWLSPKDQRFNNWIFCSETDELGVRLRDKYTSLQCPACHKIDELAAIELGISAEIRIRSKSDYFISDDGVICISTAMRRVLSDARIEGLKFVSLPGDTTYSLLLPRDFWPAEPESAGMEFHRLCSLCGRYRETCGFPATASMHLPSEGKVMGCPNLAMEDSRGRSFWFLASQEVVSVFRERKVSGLEYNLAY